MAGEKRTTPGPVSALEALEREPWACDFHQALRLIECAAASRPRVGEAARPGDDVVRLSQEPTLAFAPAALTAYEPAAGEEPARLVVRFLGLFGPNGPLPLHLTEYALERLLHHKDPTFARFADVFHHRMLSLFHRAWAAADPAAQADRPDTDRYAVFVGSLFGLGTPAVRGRGALPDRALLHHAGALACPTRHAEGLEGMLADYLGMPARVEPFVGHWVDLAPRLHTRLGQSAETCALGRTATLGTRVWDGQGKFRVVLGPASLEGYERMLPGSDTLACVVDLVRAYVGEELAWDLRVVLAKEHVPFTALGESGRLGRTSYVLSHPAEHDITEYLLDPVAATN